MSISHSQDSITSSSVEKTAVPIDKVEMAGSVTHDDHSAHAVAAHPPMSEEDKLWWSEVRKTCQEGFSEFFATMIMILFGDGVVAQVSLSENEKGNYQSISWGWGLGVMLGVYVGKKSGGHLNPAVTFANCLFRGHPWRKLPVYAIAQILGAMAGAFIVYGNYILAIDNLEGGVGVRTLTTAGVFCTYPAEFMTRTAMWFSEFVASSILMFVIFALVDPKNGNAGEFFPLALFFLIFGIGACFGWETGYAINLARDFGPRLVSYIVGYGHEVWSAGDYYFWIPMVCPFFGTAFGGFLYDVFMYDGPSPVNTPYLGLPRLFQFKRSVWSNTYQQRTTSKV